MMGNATSTPSKVAPAKPQQGFALLTVLLVVALVSVLASQMFYQQHVTVSRSAHMLHQAQSLSVAWGLEGWVKYGLRLDAKANQIDHLQEAWAEPLVSIPFEGGEISGQLFDVQGRLNLNNVSEADEDQRKMWQAVITRWAQQYELPPNFTDVLTDWVDEDETPTNSGAESDTYLLADPPYRAGNQTLVSLRTLNKLQGLQRLPSQLWQAIQLSATVLPKVTAINVNTAPVEVLISLDQQIDRRIAEQWLQIRKATPANKAADFRDFLVQQTGQKIEQWNKALPDWMISVRSEFFLLQARLDYGESQQGVSALFVRPDSENVWLIQRWLSAGDELNVGANQVAQDKSNNTEDVI